MGFILILILIIFFYLRAVVRVNKRKLDTPAKRELKQLQKETLNLRGQILQQCGLILDDPIEKYSQKYLYVNELIDNYVKAKKTGDQEQLVATEKILESFVEKKENLRSSLEVYSWKQMRSDEVEKVCSEEFAVWFSGTEDGARRKEEEWQARSEERKEEMRRDRLNYWADSYTKAVHQLEVGKQTGNSVQIMNAEKDMAKAFAEMQKYK